MDVTAYDTAGILQPATLGAIAEAIWVKGFKFSEERSIQISRPINATAPNLYDRLMAMENFQFAASQSFGGQYPNGQALKFLGTLPGLVPHLAQLLFQETADGSNQVVWLRNCGITKIELVEKSGALVTFGYTVVGGTWTLK